MFDEWERLEEKIYKEKKYKIDAYLFVHEAIGHLYKKLGEKKHVTAQELLKSISDLGRKKYAPLTRIVFEYWGVKTCMDFGRIVYDMIDFKLLSKTDEDSLADFNNGYDFKTEFDENMNLPSAIFKQDTDI